MMDLLSWKHLNLQKEINKGGKIDIIKCAASYLRQKEVEYICIYYLET